MPGWERHRGNHSSRSSCALKMWLLLQIPTNNVSTPTPSILTPPWAWGHFWQSYFTFFAYKYNGKCGKSVGSKMGKNYRCNVFLFWCESNIIFHDKRLKMLQDSFISTNPSYTNDLTCAHLPSMASQYSSGYTALCVRVCVMVVKVPSVMRVG